MPDIDDYADVLGEPQRRVWGRIAQIARRRGGVLMGGTAAALHLRHRISDDIDIMTFEEFPAGPLAMQLGQDFVNVRILDLWDNSCRAIVDGVLVDLFTPPVRAGIGPHGMRRVADGIEVCGMPVGSLPDLLSTKLEAIRFRSKLRDYVDLYAIDTLSGYTLEDGVGFYCHRFGHDDLPSDFGDSITRLSEPGVLPDDPLFDHLKDEVLGHLAGRAPAVRRHIAAQYRLLDRPPAASPPRRSERPPLSPPTATAGSDECRAPPDATGGN